ncbi:MAG TPA: hypothetical protein VLE93_01425 [Candidatus Saccharimonadales bacterium]|nr:hypothetical protein [Candidatus Saccharimonadales bacterium]
MRSTMRITGLKAVGISRAATKAAIELDNFRLGRAHGFDGLDRVIGWLEKTSAQNFPFAITNSSDPSYITGMGRALSYGWVDGRLTKVAEVEQKTAELIASLKKFRRQLGLSSALATDAEKFRDLMLKFAQEYRH